MAKRIRLMLADDQRLFTESITTLLEKYAEDIVVVGVAQNGLEAIRLVETCHPQVILMDVRMPELDGVQAAKRILARFPQVRIMMLSTFDEDEYVNEALRIGASGYVLKDIPPTELIVSIRAINEGVVQISPSVAAKLVEQHYERRAATGDGIEWYRTLSQREREIFKLIAMGFGNKQISRELQIGEQTVRNHVSSIYGKLGIRDRFQLIQLANKMGDLASEE